MPEGLPPQLEALDPLQLELLRRRLQKAKKRGAPAVEVIPRVPDAEDYPVSFAQRRLWFFDQWEPGSPAFNIPAAVRMKGSLDLGLLVRCFESVVRRHESLRTTIHRRGDEVVQKVAPPSPLPWRLVDLGGLPDAAGRREEERLAREEARRPFVLDSGPLLRLTVLRLAAGEHLLVLVIHHIVSDAWSTEILIGEVVMLYQAWGQGRPSPLPELPIRYRDYAAWQLRGIEEVLARQLGYWREKLRGAPAVVEVPTDRPRGGAQRFRGGRIEIRWPAERADEIRRLSQSCGATPFMVLLALFKVLLYRYTGQLDLVAGTLVACRNRKEIERLVGWFANALPLRTDLSGAAGFPDAVERVRQTALDAFAHQDIPFEKLVEELNPERNPSYNVLFQMMFVLLDEVREGFAIEGLEVESFEIEKGVANFDLYFSLMLGSRGVRGWVDYNEDLYDRSTAERVFAHFGALLGSAARHPGARIGDLPLLSGAEVHQILCEWNDSATAYPPARTVLDLFARQVERTPEAAAVTCEGESITYRELDRRTNRLARHLRELGVGPEVAVGVLLERSLEMVVALYGVLKAGGAYLPLEPSFPVERLELLCASAGSPVVVTRQAWAGTAARLAGTVVALDSGGPEIAARDAEALEPLAGPDNLAYVLYTSGSTGRPKGVMNVHGALLNRLLWMQAAYPLDGGDCVVQKTPFVFDVSVWEFFWPLFTGARLVVARPEGHRDGSYLAGLVRRERVTTIHFVPSMLRLFLAERDLSGCGSLTRVICSGEALTGDLVELAQARLGAEIHNLYGPTEAAIDVTFWPVPRGARLSVVPIGRPIGNLRLHVLDRELRPAPAGAAGELVIGGVGLARGYRGAPDLTARAFIPDPLSEVPGARLYRTGDLARYRSDGTLEFLGRIDHQVKVRGLRIELGEIEACLEAQPGVRQAVVMAREDVAHDQRLVAYIVPGGAEPPAEADLDAALRRRLPDYMVPGAWVLLSDLPLTTSGKVDRKALPRPQGTRREESGPRTPDEERLAAAFAEVLGVEGVGTHDNFFHLGGHSLLATRLLSRLRDLFGVEISLQELFETPSVSGLARRLRPREEEGGLPAAPALERLPRRRGEETVFPASFAQERLWFLERLDPGLIAYNEPSLTRIRGPFRPGLLQRAFAVVIGRHEALRTGFRVEDGVPVQVVAPDPAPLDLPQIDLRPLPEGRREAEARRCAAAEARRPFDLARGPLLRAVLYRTADGEHLLLLVFHHIVADGWSYYVVIRELALAYRALAEGGEPALPRLPVQYGDFAAWQRQWLRGEILERQLAFWRRQLAGAPEVLELPLDRPRPQRSLRQGRQVPLDFSHALYHDLQRRAGERGTTLFVLLLAAWQLLLRTVAAIDDVVVGFPVAGRNRTEIEGLAGFFVNTLVLRGDLGGEPALGELLMRLQGVVLKSLGHQDLPFDRLVQELQGERSMSHTPLFQVMLAFQNAIPGSVEVPGLALGREGIDIGTTKFDLTANLYELDGRLAGWLEYDVELFDHATLVRMAERFLLLLESVAAADPALPIADLPVLGTAERHQLVCEWNDTASPFAGDLCLHQLVEAQAERSPAAEAVRCEGRSLTYRELEVRANQLGRWLQAEGAGPETVVGVLLDRCLELVVALLGVLKSGAAYLPLDPSSPKDRLGFLVAEAGPRVVLTTSALADRVPSGARAVLLDATEETLAAAGDGRPEVAAGADRLAYVIYTSGSTGRPKGAMNAHRGVVNRILWFQGLHPLAAGDRVLQKTPFSFDVSVWELFWPLTAGACLVMARPGGHRDPAYLAEAVDREGITVLHFVPSMLRAFLDAGVPGSLAGVRRVITSGEELTPDLAARFFDRFGNAELHNLYGPTETAIEVTSWTCRYGVEERRVPIGRPIRNLRIHLLGRDGRPVPAGVAGELHIGGVGVGRGYLGRPELTAERFVPDPFSPEPGGRLYRTGDLARHRADGAVEYLGRTDFQVKIRGVRIELQEIEAALQRCPGVAEAAVAAREHRGDLRLVAYVVPRGGAAPAPAALRAALRETLPEAMVPAAVVVLEALPLNPNGKLDRKALPEPGDGPQGVELAAPRTYVEEILAGIWTDLLGLERLGVEDDPFELGAHSLMATRVQSRIQRELGVELPLRRIFELPTVARLAAEVERVRSLAGESRIPPLCPVPRQGALPVSFAQQRVWFFDRWEPGSAVFNLPAEVHLEGELDIAALAAGVREVVRRHESLRSRFLDVDGEPVLEIEPFAGRPFPVVDLAGLPAPQRRAERSRLVDAEARRPFDLQTGPLLRASLLRLGPREHAALLTMHHIVSDGWSLWVFTREMSAAYEAFAAGRRPELPELPVQFPDYAAWQREWLRGEVLEREVAFWRELLAGAPDSLDLPFDRRRGPVQRYRGGRRSFALGPAHAARLRALGRESGATLFMTLLAAWKTLLWRYSQQPDVTTGTVIANRHRREVEGLIGFFINTLAVRARLEETMAFPQAIARLREVMLDVYAHQDVPFEKLVEELNPERNLSLTPLFQVLFILQNTPAATLELPGLRLGVREVERDTVNYDLVFYLEEREEGLAGVLEYDLDLFDGTTVERMLAHFRVLLREAAEHPEHPLATMPLLTGAERQHILVEWNDSARSSRSPAATFDQMFEEQASLRPEALAAACGDERITYGELAAQVDRMARALAARGVGPDSIVPVLADRGIPFLTAIVSILRCGAAYLPLDPGHPRRRTGQILASSRAALVLSSREREEQAGEALETLPPGERPRLATCDALLAAGPEEGAGPPRGLPGNLAYVIFTSGSTGQPKGVMVELAGLLNNIRSKVEDLPLSPADVVAQTASQCFDISVWQFLAALAAGGTVRIVPDEVAHDAWALLREIDGSGITVLEIVPSLLQAVLDEVERLGAARPRLERLRWVMPTGEAVPSDLCRRWLAAYPHIPLLNLYGPSECSDDVSALVVRTGSEAGEGITPVGRPLRNARLYVLDPHLNPVPAGVMGELAIGGVCLGRGYLSDPARTAASFVPDDLSGEPGGRLYRTGDIARFLPDGRIDFLGRMDHQVKVRGFRIEIGEIEAVLRQHAGVGQAVVLARRDGVSAGAARLAAYVTPPGTGQAADAAELRAFLEERLPDYMVPSFFVALDALPLSPNGKIDRRALPEPVAARADAPRTPPRTWSEKVLAGIWRELLGTSEVGIEDRFFDLGGHSLLATRVLSRLRAELGVDLPLRELFELPDLRSLAARVDAVRAADPEAAAVPLVPAPPEGADLLSFAQERLWFLDQFDPGSPAYNLFNAVHLAGEVRPAVLAATLNEIVRRHATLRMTFAAVEGWPRQTVLPELVLALPLLDLSALPRERVEAETVRLARAEARTAFDLERGPLVRAALLRRGAADHVLLANMHHIASDGWSLGVFLSEVAAVYPAFAAGRPSPLPELSLQYPDYAWWQRNLLAGGVLESQLAHWKEQLAGAPEALDLPGRGARPAVLGSANGESRRFRLPAALTARLRSLGRQEGTTLFMTLLAGFASLLNRYSGAPDLMIGVPVAGRNRPELEQLIGFFVNTLVVRVRLDGEVCGRELLQRVRRASLEALTHQDLPFEKLVAELNPERDLDRSPLFQVMFALQNAPAARIDVPGLSLGRLEIDTGTIRFELYLELTEDGEVLDGMVQYSLDLFEEPFISRFVGHYGALLQGLEADPAAGLADLPLLSEAERAHILREWNDSARAIPLETPFQQLFAQTVARFPDRVAAACEGRSLTYAELDGRANAVAARLVREGIGPEGIVAVLAERGLDFLVAVVATLKAGGAYVPLDPRHPAARIRQVLEQSRASLLLCAGSLLPLGTEVIEALTGSAPVTFELEALTAGTLAESPPVRGEADHLAYVIFTSGSTGVPKGAMLVQRGLVNHLYAMILDLGLTQVDAVAQTAPQSFDISVWQFLTPLLTGGRVEIYPDAVAHDPAVLLDRLEADGVAVLEIVPSLMRLMLEEIRRRGAARPALSRLRWLIPTGEAVPPELCRDWHSLYPGVSQVNGYGPAECSDDVSLYRIPVEEAAASRAVPIGRPILNSEIYILDAALRPVPLRVAGELCIGGDGVGRGYLFDPARTAACFVPDPFSGRRGGRMYRSGDLARFREDGVLEFLGRFDHQVKIRGHRLELGEIEAALGEHPGLSGAVVMARPEPSGAQRLVAWVVSRTAEAPSPQELRELLRSRLPEYAIPTAWVALERFPLNPNGKVDRRALPDPEEGALGRERSYEAPRSDMEAAVAEIFAAVIGIDRVGAFDHFFDLGGHSLLATQVIWRLRESFGVELALRSLFEAPTVAELAAVVEDRIIEQIESMSDEEVDGLLTPDPEADPEAVAHSGERGPSA